MNATPDRRARRRDADENLGALLEAAARVLADDPAATMAQIASASGLERVTAWRQVGSREQLLALLNERAVGEISRDARATARRPARHVRGPRPSR